MLSSLLFPNGFPSMQLLQGHKDPAQPTVEAAEWCCRGSAEVPGLATIARNVGSPVFLPMVLGISDNLAIAEAPMLLKPCNNWYGRLLMFS